MDGGMGDGSADSAICGDGPRSCFGSGSIRAMDGRSCLDRDAQVWAKRSLFVEGCCCCRREDELGVETVRDTWGRLRMEEDAGLDDSGGSSR